MKDITWSERLVLLTNPINLSLLTFLLGEPLATLEGEGGPWSLLEGEERLLLAVLDMVDV